MPVPLLPEYLNQVNTHVNHQHKISKAYAKDMDDMMDRIGETDKNNTNIVDFVRVLQQRQLSGNTCW